MRHREATQYLPDLGTGSLEPETEAALASHAEQCSACRDWLAAYRLLADMLSPIRTGSLDHPDSDLLALCVVRPDEVHELDREGLRDHLQRCTVCRGDLARIRAAVLDARPMGSRESAPIVPKLSQLPRRGQRVAAAFVILLLGGGILTALGLLFDHLGPRDSSLHDGARVTARLPAPSRPMEELSGRDLDGTQIIGSDQALLVSKLTVKSKADVTFQAREVVAFGDGFRVADGARMRVESRPSAERDSRTTEPISGDRPRD